jgi:hypothetical protein
MESIIADRETNTRLLQAVFIADDTNESVGAKITLYKRAHYAYLLALAINYNSLMAGDAKMAVTGQAS